MKQVTHAFGYRFWSKSMPKLNRFLRKNEAHSLKAVTNEQDQQRIQKTIQAIEGFVMCQCIAMGLLQLVVLQFSGRTSELFFRYLRKPSHAVVSESSVAAYLRKSIFRLFAQNPHLSLTKIIKSNRKTRMWSAIRWFLSLYGPSPLPGDAPWSILSSTHLLYFRNESTSQGKPDRVVELMQVYPCST
jgi:hypothetical protein